MMQDDIDNEIEKLRIRTNICNLQSRFYSNRKKLLELERERGRLEQLIAEDDKAIKEFEGQL
jgi:hypothetical protein